MDPIFLTCESPCLTVHRGHCLLGRGKSCLFGRFLDRLTSVGDNRLIWGPFRSVTKRHREPGKFPSWYEGFSIRCLYTCTCILKRISMSTIIDFDLHVEKRTNITILFTKTYKRKKTPLKIVISYVKDE